MTMKTPSYISHPACRLHDPGSWHPERPARLNAIRDYLIATGRLGLMREREAPEATREQLERVHTPTYVANMLDRPVLGVEAIDPDTIRMPDTMPAALRAAGAGVLAVDTVLAPARRRDNTFAFCAVRPPGHHATPDRAMGFCFFNNVAVAAAHAFATHGVGRVAIVDFDAHHGNGTQDWAASQDRVFFCSSFEHPMYPYSGSGPTPDHILNVPLTAGTASEAFRAAYEEKVLPRLEAYNAELLLLSAGFDGHAADPYANLNLNDDDFGWVTGALRSATDCPVVSVLEGGYDLRALARSVAAHLDALM